jgi:hypothetical protein
VTGRDRPTAEHAVVRATPEMSRPYPISRLGGGARFVVDAKPEECVALSARMGLLAVYSLTCRFDLRPGEGGAIAASGLLQARVRQTCVVSLDPFDDEVAEEFSLHFVPLGMESEDLDLEADDEIPYEGGVLDLGEAASEQLALALDPFPRKPGAELRESVSSQEAGVFWELGKLRSPH